MTHAYRNKFTCVTGTNPFWGKCTMTTPPPSGPSSSNFSIFSLCHTWDDAHGLRELCSHYKSWQWLPSPYLPWIFFLFALKCFHPKCPAKLWKLGPFGSLASKHEQKTFNCLKPWMLCGTNGDISFQVLLFSSMPKYMNYEKQLNDIVSTSIS